MFTNIQEKILVINKLKRSSDIKYILRHEKFILKKTKKQKLPLKIGTLKMQLSTIFAGIIVSQQRACQY